MRFHDFLKDRAGRLAVCILFLAALEVMLIPMREPFLQIYIGVGIPMGFCFDIWVEYRKKKRFYEKADRQLQEMDQIYLLPEIMEEPNFLEGKYMIHFLREMETSMVEQVKKYRSARDEYKDYIEMWIHEVKIPIAAGRMIVENHRSQWMDSVEEEFQKIEDYTEQALYYARSYNVEKDYMIKEVPLQEIVSEVLQKNKKTLISAKIRIVMDGLEQTVFTDSKWMVFILNQIVSNAVKYRKEEPVLSFLAVKKKEQVVFSIKDNGVGIPANEVNRVFEKGFTGSNGRRQQKSTGIGLYLCRKLCLRLGHRIAIYSRDGEGTEISILFPRTEYYRP